MFRVTARRGWYLYDWSNSAFSTSVAGVFYGPYLTDAARAAADANGYVHFGGLQLAVGLLFPYLLACSVLLQLFLFPILSAAADRSGSTRKMLALFAAIGSTATVALCIPGSRDVASIAALFLLASIGFSGSVVFYNALLPQVSSGDDRDRVSCIGGAIGYLGGGVLLAVHLAVLYAAPSWNWSSDQAVRFNLGSSGVWWGAFAALSLFAMRGLPRGRGSAADSALVTDAVHRLTTLVGNAAMHRQAFLFAGAHALYNTGVHTVVALGAQFGYEELKLPIETLAAAILAIQFLGFTGPLIFERVAAVLGLKAALMVCLAGWIALVVYGYGFMYTKQDYFVLAVGIAMVIGSTETLSRSWYTRLLPRDHAATFFSFYELAGSAASWTGPLAFGLALQLSGSRRLALLVIAVFFVAGAALLTRVIAPGSLPAGEDCAAAEPAQSPAG